jgi:hypothetical protein
LKRRLEDLRWCGLIASASARRAAAWTLYAVAAVLLVLGATMGAGCAWFRDPIDRKALEKDLMSFDDEDLNRDLAGGDLGITGGASTGGGGGGGGSC